MNHEEAVLLKAPERYILGELSPEDREQFEEHYFDCLECASDLRTLARFRNASQLVFREDAAALRPRREFRAGWLNWLSPKYAISAIAVLLAIVVFQATVTIPALEERRKVQNVGQLYESSYRVRGTTRGESRSTIAVRANQTFALDFDFTPNKSFSSYKGTLIDAAGKIAFAFDVEGQAANKELHLVIPGGIVKPGNYVLTFAGQNGGTDSGSSGEEVERLSFVVEFRP
jgi:hypothetical protein